MKKITLILALGVMGLVSLTSCKKDYICECITDDNSGGKVTTKTKVSAETKKKAKETCDQLDLEITKTECEIK